MKNWIRSQFGPWECSGLSLDTYLTLYVVCADPELRTFFLGPLLLGSEVCYLCVMLPDVLYNFVFSPLETDFFVFYSKSVRAGKIEYIGSGLSSPGRLQPSTEETGALLFSTL